MKRLLFLNRFPVIDGFVTSLITTKVPEVTIVRTVSDFMFHFDQKQYDVVLINVDDRLQETPYAEKLSNILSYPTKVIVFGQYQNDYQMLKDAGVTTFLPNEPKMEDFEEAIDFMPLYASPSGYKFMQN